MIPCVPKHVNKMCSAASGGIRCIRLSFSSAIVAFATAQTSSK